MKKFWLALALFSATVFSSDVLAKDSPHTKILLHGSQVKERGWVMAGWVILPDINNNGRVLSVLGPRYTAKKWWLEVMAGAVVSKNQSGQPEKMWLIDIRFSPPALGKHFTHWINVEWVDLPKGRTGRYYLYYQADLNLPWQLGKVGVETENTWKPGKDSLSAGPHLVAPIGSRMKIAIAYQWHRRFEGNQWWFRTVIDL